MSNGSIVSTAIVSAIFQIGSRFDRADGAQVSLTNTIGNLRSCRELERAAMKRMEAADREIACLPGRSARRSPAQPLLALLHHVKSRSGRNRSPDEPADERMVRKRRRAQRQRCSGTATTIDVVSHSVGWFATSTTRHARRRAVGRNVVQRAGAVIEPEHAHREMKQPKPRRTVRSTRRIFSSREPGHSARTGQPQPTRSALPPPRIRRSTTRRRTRANRAIRPVERRQAAPPCTDTAARSIRITAIPASPSATQRKSAGLARRRGACQRRERRLAIVATDQAGTVVKRDDRARFEALLRRAR